MSKGKEIKRPGAKSTSGFSIEQEPVDQPNYDLSKPVFSFYHMQYGRKCCLSCSNATDKVSISDRLIALSQKTWRELASISRTGLGYEKIPQKQFKVSLPPSVTEEVTIQVFRHSHAGRIAGFRQKDVYHIILVGDDLYDH